MSLKDSAPTIQNDGYWKVTAETFGHLAPKKNVTYRGEITCSVSNYYSGTAQIIDIRLGDMNDNPWVFDAVEDLLFEMSSNDTKVLEEGHCYVIKTTFRNYQFWTKIIKDIVL